jgi:hypothetical protein
MWTKYDYLCTDCDALIEITITSNLKHWRGWCPCGSPNLIMLGYEDATVKVSPEYVSDFTPTEVVKINSNHYN